MQIENEEEALEKTKEYIEKARMAFEDFQMLGGENNGCEELISSINYQIHKLIVKLRETK